MLAQACRPATSSNFGAFRVTLLQSRDTVNGGAALFAAPLVDPRDGVAASNEPEER